MADEMSSQKVIEKCTELQKFWAPRNEQFQEWYELIEMVDTLKQKDMESFVGNDPRAAFNLMLSMLEQDIPHRIPPEGLTQEQVAPAAELSKLFEVAWDDVYYQYRKRGRYFLRDLISFLLATGWYAVFALMSQDGKKCIAEVWHPATVYPLWDEGLAECAHIFDLNEAKAKAMVSRLGWTVPSLFGYNNTVYDYWFMDGDKVYNSIVMNNHQVKVATHEMKFSQIPIFISPVGGLPDTGELSPKRQSNRWKKEVGQSVLATNQNIYNYWNKWWSFSLQLLRDTAQPRTYEKKRGGKRIVKPEEWYGRGAHFEMGPEDEIGFLTPPAIPVEMRSTQLDMEAMMQRGGPSWAMFGSIQQKVTAYVMSQIASSANQISRPYHRGVIDCITDIDNFWLDMIKEFKYKPYGRGLPQKLPKEARLSADYEIRIPGDLIQRVTTARIMNPAFVLSEEKVMEELFPEIKSPAEEMAKIRAGKVRRSPVFTTIAEIEAYKEEARLLRKAGDDEAAALYEKAAKLAEAMLELPQQPAQAPAGGQPGVRPPGVRPEVVPPAGLGLEQPEEA